MAFRLALASVFSASIALLPSLASAQAARTDPPLGKMDFRTPAPAPIVPRSYRLHDGFYARASVGFGTLSANFDDDHVSDRDLSGSGLGLGMQLMLGGSPSPGLAVGGALLAHGAFPAEFERSATATQDRSLAVGILGPFIDGFPVATKGWHLGGMLGLALANVEGSSSDQVSATRGLGGAAWFGHDFWVADEWSVGPMLQLAATVTRDGDSDTGASTFSLLLLFTALRH